MIDGAGSAPTSYADIAQLHQRRTDTPENLRAAAEQFEALLADVWIKSMRSATDALGGGLVASHALGVHKEMLDHQWAVHMAENGGLGIADVIVRQLQRDVPIRTQDAANVDVTTLSRLPVRASVARTGSGPGTPLALQSYIEETTAAAETTHAAAARTTPVPPGSSAQRAPLFTSPQAFVREVLPVVREIVAPLGLNPEAVVAQAALETGWGQAVIAGRDGASSHNLFGIKAGETWQGPTSEVRSNEFIDGVMQPVSASFRAYTSVRDSVEDLVALLRGGARYAGVLEAGSDANGYAEALQAAGYATDPEYSAKIGRIATSQLLMP